MHRWILTTVALVGLGAPAAAQDTKALDLVPDDALGFVLVKDLRQLSDRVENLAKKLEVAERFSLLEVIQKELGIRDGLNEKGSAVFIVLYGKGDKPGPVSLFAVAVTDHGKVAEQLGVKQPRDGINEGEMGVQSSFLASIGGAQLDEKTKKVRVLFAKRGEFVVLASPENRDALERVLKSQKSIAASVQPARDWLAEQDISGVCTQNGVKVGLLMLLIGVIGDSTGDQAKRMMATFAEVEKNVKLVAFGGRIEEAGHCRLSTRVYFDPQGEYAKWIADARPADGKAPAGLPDQPYLLAGLARLSAQMNFEGAIRLLTSSLPADTADKLTKQAAQLLQRVSEVGLAVYTDPRKTEDATVEVGLVARVDDAPAFVKGTVELLRQVREATKDKYEAEVTFEQVKLAGRPSWLIRYVQKKKEPKDGKPGSPEWRGVLVLTELNAQTVFAAVLRDADRAEAFVKKVGDGSTQPLAKNPGLQKTAALLPEKVNLAAYLNIQPLASLFGFMNTAEAECPPVAFALSVFPAGIEAQFVIPFDTLQAVAKAWKGDKKPEPKDK
jgi:hypothetical protein